MRRVLSAALRQTLGLLHLISPIPRRSCGDWEAETWGARWAIPVGPVGGERWRRVLRAHTRRRTGPARHRQPDAHRQRFEQVELCYSPPFGSAKDPINFAGTVGVDVLRGNMPLTHWNSLNGGFLLDVRENIELAVEHVPDATTIPLGELRSRLDEIPATEGSLSSAAPADAPTPPPACSSRKGSTPALSPEECSPTRSTRHEMRRFPTDTRPTKTKSQA